jgi:hypothetical protein
MCLRLGQKLRRFRGRGGHWLLDQHGAAMPDTRKGVGVVRHVRRRDNCAPAPHRALQHRLKPTRQLRGTSEQSKSAGRRAELHALAPSRASPEANISSTLPNVGTPCCSATAARRPGSISTAAARVAAGLASRSGMWCAVVHQPSPTTAMRAVGRAAGEAAGEAAGSRRRRWPASLPMRTFAMLVLLGDVDMMVRAACAAAAPGRSHQGLRRRGAGISGHLTG